MRFIIPLGLLLWSIFSPFHASLTFILLAALIEGYFLILELIKNPDLNFARQKYHLTENELYIFKKYYVFYHFPITASKASMFISGFIFSGVIWVPWLLYNRLWIQAIIIGLNIILANYLSKKLRPLHFANMLSFKSKYSANKEIIKSVYDKVVWKEGV